MCGCGFLVRGWLDTELGGDCAEPNRVELVVCQRGDEGTNSDSTYKD